VQRRVDTLKFTRFVALHCLRNTQMIVSERVCRIFPQELTMKANCLSVILNAEKMVGRGIAKSTR
jgi:hypothetical protein